MCSCNIGRFVALLLVLAAVAVSVETNMNYESTVLVNKDVVVTDSKFMWLPDDELRASWVAVTLRMASGVSFLRRSRTHLFLKFQALFLTSLMVT